MRRTLGLISVAFALVACGTSTAGPSPATPSPTKAPISARGIAAVPGDFAPTAVTACASPETGPYADFAAAFRMDIKYHANIAAVAALVTQAGADTWVSSFAAPDAKPAVCRGALGFAYTPRSVGREPDAQSQIFVFKDAAAAQAAYGQIQQQLVPHPTTTGAATGFGSESAVTDITDSHRVAWLRGQVVAFMLIEDVDNWQAAPKAVDARLIR